MESKNSRETVSWKKMFSIERYETEVKEEFRVSYLFKSTRKIKKIKFAVVLINSGFIYGMYDDEKYAASRARFFYKKFLKESEKALLS